MYTRCTTLFMLFTVHKQQDVCARVLQCNSKHLMCYYYFAFLTIGHVLTLFSAIEKNVFSSKLPLDIMVRMTWQL